MKCRVGFVSNSSSSSFIVIGKEPEKNITYVKLEKEMARKIIKNLKIDWDGKKDVYLTGFIDECYPVDESWEEYLSCSCVYVGSPDYININEDFIIDPIFVFKGDLQKNFYKKKFIKEVKKLAKEFKIKNYTLEVADAD